MPLMQYLCSKDNMSHQAQPALSSRAEAGAFSGLFLRVSAATFVISSEARNLK
jgi:hypothetical protein